MISKISEYLQGYPLIVAYLFGSHAAGRPGRLSDVDIALYTDPLLSASERFDLRLKLSSLLSSVLRQPADIVMLNDTPVHLSYEVIKHGKVIFCRDPEFRVEMETNILRKYLDRRYYDKKRADRTLARIASGGHRRQ